MDLVRAEPGHTCQRIMVLGIAGGAGVAPSEWPCGAPATVCDLDAPDDQAFFCEAHNPGEKAAI